MRFVHGGDFWESVGNKKNELIDFSSSINPFGVPEDVEKEIKAWKIKHYPPLNHEKLKDAVSEYINDENAGKAKTGTENIVLGAGSMELIKNYCELFFASKNFKKSALIPIPSFSEYERYSELYGAEINFAGPKRDLKIDTEKIIDMAKKLKNKKQVLLFLCNPNNPTGASLDNDDVEIVLNCLENSNAALFLDECFTEFSSQKSLCPEAAERDNLFIIRSFTKFFALPGLRIGYGISGRKTIKKLEKLALPWNINIFAHDAAIACLKDKEYMKKSRTAVKRERKFLSGELKKIGLKVSDSDANFLLVENNWDAKKLKAWLLAKGLLIRECSSFRGLDRRFIRVSVRLRGENKILVERIKEYLELKNKSGNI